MSNFIYNEDTRIHTLDGIILPSVSQIIEPLTNFDNIPVKVLERKKQLGIYFHLAIELYALDDLRIDSLDSNLIKPMNSFIQWEKSQDDRKSAIYEKPLHHKTLKYCGKPDRISDTRIIDFKLRRYNPITDCLQLEAYRHMVNHETRALWTVCFDLEGKISVHDAYHSQAWAVFRKLLDRWKSEQKFN